MGEALQICGKGERVDRSAAIAALPACLTSWAVEEFETVPRKYIEKVPWEEAPIFETLLEVLKPKMQQYKSPRATRSEFKSPRQNENESMKKYFRGVRYLGDLALCEKTLEEKNKDLRDQFLEGLFDSRLQQKLYEDETNRNFLEALQRAQELELIRKTQGRWTSGEKRQHEQTECDFLMKNGSKTVWSGPAFRNLTVT